MIVSAVLRIKRETNSRLGLELSREKTRSGTLGILLGNSKAILVQMMLDLFTETYRNCVLIFIKSERYSNSMGR